MNRRDFLRSATLVSAGLALPGTGRAWDGPPPDHDAWRTFELTTRVDVLHASGTTRVWVPIPLTIETAYQQPLGNSFDVAAGGLAKLIDDHPRGFAMVAAEWRAAARPALTVTSRVRTRDIRVDFETPSETIPPGPAALARFLEPSALIPSDGIVKQTATEITRGAMTGLEKARAIYDWIVDNSFRNPATRGCGTGDIRYMLESKDLSGKCADLNALYAGLAHAVGLPARDAYGVRVAKSALGYTSLGLPGDNASKAQHCRAEVYVESFGWVPIDPADVLKVALEEPPGHLSKDDPKVRAARARLFGAWEMNWVAYNFEHDVKLPGSRLAKLPFFMYPQCETGNGRLDSLDPERFHYSITVRELAPARATESPGTS